MIWLPLACTAPPQLAEGLRRRRMYGAAAALTAGTAGLAAGAVVNNYDRQVRAARRHAIAREIFEDSDWTDELRAKVAPHHLLATPAAAAAAGTGGSEQAEEGFPFDGPRATRETAPTQSQSDWPVGTCHMCLETFAGEDAAHESSEWFEHESSPETGTQQRVVLQPCGHHSMCFECARTNMVDTDLGKYATGFRKCPECRGWIKKVQRLPPLDGRPAPSPPTE